MTVRAEWTKVRTLRSTWWSLLLAAALCVGLAILFRQSIHDSFDRMDAERQTNFDPTSLAFYSLTIGQIALVVFGVLQVSSEYTTGTIRASLAAVPRRGLFFGTKVGVGLLVAAVLSVVVAFGTFFAAQWGLAEHGTTLGAPGVLRAVLGAAAYLTLMCGFAMGVAAMLRSTAASLGIMIPILFLNSQGLANLPAIRPVTQYLPDQAGAGLMQVVPADESMIGHRDFGPAGALLILVAWTAAAIAGGLLTVRRRDA